MCFQFSLLLMHLLRGISWRPKLDSIFFFNLGLVVSKERERREEIGILYFQEAYRKQAVKCVGFRFFSLIKETAITDIKQVCPYIMDLGLGTFQYYQEPTQPREAYFSATKQTEKENKDHFSPFSLSLYVFQSLYQNLKQFIPSTFLEFLIIMIASSSL